jgi:hypothetical protein
MLDSNKITLLLQQEKSFLKKRFKVKKIGLFGSFAKNNANKNSDIDILIDFEPSIGWDFFDLSDYLEKKLGQKIDLVSLRAIKPELKDSILNDVIFV